MSEKVDSICKRQQRCDRCRRIPWNVEAWRLLQKLKHFKDEQDDGSPDWPVSRKRKNFEGKRDELHIPSFPEWQDDLDWAQNELSSNSQAKRTGRHDEDVEPAGFGCLLPHEVAHLRTLSLRYTSPSKFFIFFLKHHQDIKSLANSAVRGCQLCRFLFDLSSRSNCTSYGLGIRLESQMLGLSKLYIYVKGHRKVKCDLHWKRRNNLDSSHDFDYFLPLKCNSLSWLAFHIHFNADTEQHLQKKP